MKAKKTLAITAMAATGIFTTLAATPAYASGTAWHGSDSAYASGGYIQACDGERDGNGVYAEAYWSNGPHQTIWDGNGSASGCSWVEWGTRISRYRVCEDHVGCSAWRYDA